MDANPHTHTHTDKGTKHLSFLSANTTANSKYKRQKHQHTFCCQQLFLFIIKCLKVQENIVLLCSWQIKCVFCEFDVCVYLHVRKRSLRCESNPLILLCSPLSCPLTAWCFLIRHRTVWGARLPIRQEAVRTVGVAEQKKLCFLIKVIHSQLNNIFFNSITSVTFILFSFCCPCSNLQQNKKTLHWQYCLHVDALLQGSATLNTWRAIRVYFSLTTTQ